ncbi:MAG: hypothetical protein ACO3G4_12180 [Opitutaceae bacterium]
MTPAALRALLAERFPSGASRQGAVEPAGLLTGLPALDVGGGLPRGAITELICPGAGGGASLLLGGLLAASRAGGSRAALVDAHDAFDPDSFPAAVLSHLVWVRCPNPGQALAVADLLVRDANFRLVVLDLRRLSAPLLRRVPVTHWHRLRLAAETGGTTLLVQTPAPAVPSARLRLVLAPSLPLAALEEERRHLLAALAPVRTRHQLAAAV